MPEAPRLVNSGTATISICGYLTASLIFPSFLFSLALSSCIPNIFFANLFQVQLYMDNFSDNETHTGTCALSAGQLGVKSFCSLPVAANCVNLSSGNHSSFNFLSNEPKRRFLFLLFSISQSLYFIIYLTRKQRKAIEP